MQESETALAGPALPTQDAGTSACSPAGDISMETTEVAFRVAGVWKGLQILEESFHTTGFVSCILRGPTGLRSHQKRHGGAAQAFKGLTMLALCFAFCFCDLCSLAYPLIPFSSPL